MRSRDASLSTTAGTGEAIISDAPRGEKLLETLHHPRFVAPSRNGIHHGVTPGTLRYLREPGGDEHILVERSAGKSGELLPDRVTCFVRVVVDAYREVGNQRRDRAPSPVCSRPHSGQRDVVKIGAGAHPANRTISFGPTHLKRLDPKGRTHDRYIYW